MAVRMLAPSAFQKFLAAPSGTNYTADANGILASVDNNDVSALERAGCLEMPVWGNNFIGKLIGANMNVTTDQAITLYVPAAAKFRVTKITAENASTNPSTAVGGVYNAVSKGGTAMVAATQTYAMAAATTAFDLTVAAGPGATVQAAGTQLYLSLTTAQGGAATADFYVFGDVYL